MNVTPIRAGLISLAASIALCGACILPATVTHAQTPVVLAAEDAPQTEGFSRLGDIEETRQSSEGGAQRVQLSEFFTAVYQALSRIVIVAAFLSGIYGAYLYMFQGSDPKKVATAREYIVYAVAAIIIVAILFALAQVLTPGLIKTSTAVLIPLAY